MDGTWASVLFFPQIRGWSVSFESQEVLPWRARSADKPVQMLCLSTSLHVPWLPPPPSACPQSAASWSLWRVIWLNSVSLRHEKDWVVVARPDLMLGRACLAACTSPYLDVTVPTLVNCLMKAWMTARWELLCWLQVCYHKIIVMLHIKW